ncbi:hypothetical protein P3T33_005216 [Rhizobium sp. AN67]|nr:hypothetical protein [Rhizobium sp. AN67]SOD50221.1 hypothetical protein SAMN05216595_0046 [Rhizobium sp. AN6A]
MVSPYHLQVLSILNVTRPQRCVTRLAASKVNWAVSFSWPRLLSS